MARPGFLDSGRCGVSRGAICHLSLGTPSLVGVWYTWLWSGSLCARGRAVAPAVDGETEAQGAAGHTAGEGGLC